MSERIAIVFSGPPSAQSPEFIEVEDGDGNSITLGDWMPRADGYWELQLEVPQPKVQFATCAVGVFGPLGQGAVFYDTADEAWERARDSSSMIGPITRETVTVGGKEFTTEWKSLARNIDEIASWKPGRTRCGASNPKIDNGKPCILFEHTDRHVTGSGAWWAV